MGLKKRLTIKNNATILTRAYDEGQNDELVLKTGVCVTKGILA